MRGTPHRRVGSPRHAAVAVVNEAFARRFCAPGADRLAGGYLTRIYEVDINIVGIAGDGKYAFTRPARRTVAAVRHDPRSAQRGLRISIVLHVRADGDPLALAPAVQPASWAEWTRRLTATSPATLDDCAARCRSSPIRLASPRAAGARRAALVLASLGLYAVIALRRHPAATGDRDPDGPRHPAGSWRVSLATRAASSAGAVTGAGSQSRWSTASQPGSRPSC